jgi:zinc transport system substrate-binding protein
MMVKLIRLTGLALLFGVAATGCNDDPAVSVDTAPDSAQVVAVNSPLMYFAQRLAGEALEAKLLAPADIDPASWYPGVEDVLALQQAGLIFLNGAGYESWLDKVSISAGKLVNTSERFRDRWIQVEDQVTHSHGPQGEHAHGDFAFTTWMDMSMAREQAEAVAEALTTFRPSLAEEIEDNLVSLLADLAALDAGYREAAAALADRKRVYSHPVYQYFERRYDLHGTSLHWEPDAMPEQAEWDALAALANGDRILLVWEGEPAAEIEVQLRDLGIEWVVVEPGANRKDRDWLQVQRDNLDRLGGLAAQ